MGLRTYIKKNFELVISFVAVAMAVAAVVVAFYETSLMREQARLSVKPSIWFDQNTVRADEESSLEIIVSNRGLGPASLGYFTVSFSGKYLKSWKDWIPTVSEGEYVADTSDDAVNHLSRGTVPAYYVLADGRDLQTLKIRGSAELIESLRAGMQKSELTMCACSFYEDCWITRGIDTAPQPIDDCKLEEGVPRFQNGRS